MTSPRLRFGLLLSRAWSSLGPSHGAAATLRSLVVLENDIAGACEFFREGLGARVVVATEGWAELEIDNGQRPLSTDQQRPGGHPAPMPDPTVSPRSACGTTTLHIMKRHAPADSDGHHRQLPSTLLVFTVPHVQDCIERMIRHGGQMDGRIEYSPDGTTQAVVTTPGGTSIGLVSD